MKPIFSILAALSLSLGLTSPLFADMNMDPPDTLQKNKGPGNLDATAPALDKKKPAVPTPSPIPTPKVPEKKLPAY